MSQPFSKHTFIYNNIPKTLSLFYFCLTMLSASIYLPALSIEQYNKMSPPPLLSFVKFLPEEVVLFMVNITPCILILTGLLPRHRILRILSAVFYTFSYGFVKNTFGIDSHDQLIPVYSTISLAFMPSFEETEKLRRKRHITVLYFWVFHAVFFLPYFISGLTKLFYGGIYQFFFDEVSIWSFSALAYVTEDYLTRIGGASWMGNFIINNVWLSGLMYLLATILELACLLPLWIPKLWKLLILKLVLFHIAIMYVLNILFFANTLILLIVFYNTPFGYPLNSIFNSSFKKFFQKTS